MSYQTIFTDSKGWYYDDVFEDGCKSGTSWSTNENSTLHLVGAVNSINN